MMYVIEPSNTVQSIVTSGTCGLGTAVMSRESLNQQNQESRIQDR